MKTTLVLLAAGKGSRYGGLKQLEGFGPNGELIMDYSIADAVDAGFSKIVLVVREEHRAEFEAKMAKHAYRDRFELDFAYQREPLGTADAARSAAGVVDGPCAVINSDDYYGGLAVYRQVQEFLSSYDAADQPPRYALLGYPIAETLSPHGKVSRGICQVDADHQLLYLEENYELHRDPESGRIVGKNAAGEPVEIAEGTMCSMAYWLLPPQFMIEVEKDFQAYLSRPRIEGRAGEFLLTTVIEEQRASGRADVYVLPIDHSEWCGVTSPGDRDGVCAQLAAYHQQGRYGVLRLP